MRKGISFPVTADDRRRLDAIIAARSSPQKHVWRCRIVLLSKTSAFLNKIEKCVPKGQKFHAILDNVSSHKTPEVLAWLARNKRWTFHFTPTSASWLNAVEGFFSKLTRRRLKFGVFKSVPDLEAAITRFIQAHNETEAKPFKWIADPDKIIAARNRGFQMLDSIH